MLLSFQLAAPAIPRAEAEVMPDVITLKHPVPQNSLIAGLARFLTYEVESSKWLKEEGHGRTVPKYSHSILQEMLIARTMIGVLFGRMRDHGQLWSCARG